MQFEAIVTLFFCQLEHLYCLHQTTKQYSRTIHRELKLNGAIGHFAEPLCRLKTGHFTT